MEARLEKLWAALQQLEQDLKNNGASLSMQSRARDARNAVTWLQERIDGREIQS